MRPPLISPILRDLLPLGKTAAVAMGLMWAVGPALAQGEGAAAKQPYAGPQYPGKPPPLGAAPAGPQGGAAPSPGFQGGPVAPPGAGARPPVAAGADGLPGAGVRPASTGTGFVVAEGWALTNAHVAAECGLVVAHNAQRMRVPARLRAVDAKRDLALLAIPPGFGPPLPFRESPPLRRGEGVVTYGFPLSGLLSSGPTLTSGDVSALSGLRDDPITIQISAPVQPGNSGGPLLDSQARVVGVVVSKLNAARVAELTGGDIPQNVNFAIKGSEALIFLRSQNVFPTIAGGSGPEKQRFEVGEIVHPSTLWLQCYR